MKSMVIEQADCHLERRNSQQVDHEALLEAGYRSFLGKNDTVIDVGSHSGRHTVVFADLVGAKGTVIAVEPLPKQADFLRHRFRDQKNVRVVEAVIAESKGPVSFCHAVNAPQESGLVPRVAFNVKDVELEQISVNAITLDDLCRPLERVSFIKMDIEGAEITCINSGIQSILRLRPLMSVEYGQPAYAAYGHSKQDLFDLAARIGFVLGDLFGNPITTAEEWDYVCDRAYWDFFMIPQERVDFWISRFSSVHV